MLFVYLSLLVLLILIMLHSQTWARKRAARGARLLDENKQGWFTKIDTKLLDPSKYSHCVLSQVFASSSDSYPSDAYSVGLRNLRLTGEIKIMRYGFFPNILATNTYNERLTKAWIAEINSRIARDEIAFLYVEQ